MAMHVPQERICDRNALFGANWSTALHVLLLCRLPMHRARTAQTLRGDASPVERLETMSAVTTNYPQHIISFQILGSPASQKNGPKSILVERQNKVPPGESKIPNDIQEQKHRTDHGFPQRALETRPPDKRMD